MWFLAHEAGNGKWDGLLGLAVIAVLCISALAGRGMLAFIRWMLPPGERHKS